MMISRGNDFEVDDWEVVMEQSVGNVEGRSFYIRVASRREELWLLRLSNRGSDANVASELRQHKS
jgi:hypothetical protein